MTDWTSIRDFDWSKPCADPTQCCCVMHPVSVFIGHGWQRNFCGCCDRTWSVSKAPMFHLHC